MLVRDGQHREVGTEAFGYARPWARTCDHSCGIRLGRIVPLRWSSVSTITTLGRASTAVEPGEARTSPGGPPASTTATVSTRRPGTSTWRARQLRRDVFTRLPWWRAGRS